ncbi:hypothetical protein [Nostoc sp. NMS9]|uniref:hypothetical protein n=1 Tax=Nostoc sp. NMS9 TaxID=2815393 RepID=UPI0025D35AF7|nr:hypothetical protein [Nostoc sp. NMS9]MBN3943164.1 hypothetical protein [Nostoc sp. NMS9]
MNTSKKILSNSVDVQALQNTQVAQKASDASIEQLTRGQQLADKLANHVGSWKFLICQSTILAAKDAKGRKKKEI